MTRAPKDVARAAVAAYNAKELGSVLDLYRPNSRYWDPLHQEGVASREAVGNAITGMFASVPDEQLAIQTLAGDEIVDGDIACRVWSETATTADGKPWVNHGVGVARVRGGKIVSLHENNDVNLVFEHSPS